MSRRDDLVEHGHDQHEGRPHGHESHETPRLIDLAELAEALLADLTNHPAGRTAKTVMSGTVMRVVVVALADGVEMSEHDAPPAATMHVLEGEVVLRVGEQQQPVRAGQLVPLPKQRHAVLAASDAVFLLTVALR